MKTKVKNQKFIIMFNLLSLKQKPAKELNMLIKKTF